MAGKRQPAKKVRKAPRKAPEDTTVHVPLSFEDAIDAFLRTPPPGKPKK